MRENLKPRMNAKISPLDPFLADEHGRQLAVVVNALREARTVLVLTGAGISTESGLPTYRGPGGLWDEQTMRRVSTKEGFHANPQRAWAWYNERWSEIAKSEPGKGHLAITKLQKTLPGLVLATQNVDGLHQRAGSIGVIELHGNMRGATCDVCGHKRSLDGPLPHDQIAHACGGMYQPNVVKFGELLSASNFLPALEASQRADVILSIGTSQLVMPAAALLAPKGRNPLVVDINPRPDFGSSSALTTLPYTAAEILPPLADHLESVMQKSKTHRDPRRTWMGLPA